MASLASSGPTEAAAAQHSDAHLSASVPGVAGDAEEASIITSPSGGFSSSLLPRPPAPGQPQQMSSGGKECKHSSSSSCSSCNNSSIDVQPNCSSVQPQEEFERPEAQMEICQSSSGSSSASPSPPTHATHGVGPRMRCVSEGALGAAVSETTATEDSKGHADEAPRTVSAGASATSAAASATGAAASGEVKREISGEGALVSSSSEGGDGQDAKEQQSAAAPLDIASLFLSPSQDLDSWAQEDGELLLPAGSFVSADAISCHRGPMTLGRVAMFLFSLFQGDVRMGLLSAQGRLLAWRCLLYLAELHDRQTAGTAQQQQPTAAQAAAATADPSMRRRRLQRESVATSKGRRSVRHAFLLDRSGAARPAPPTAVAGTAAAANPPAAAGNSSSYSPGAADEWAEAEEEPPSAAAGAAAAAAAASAAACATMRGEPPAEAVGEQPRSAPVLSGALLLQRQLQQQQQQQGQPSLGFETNFTRFVGGTIDRRWALQHKWLRIPAGTLQVSEEEGQKDDETNQGEESNTDDEALDIRFEEFGAATAPTMWPRAEALPEKIFVGEATGGKRQVPCGSVVLVQ
ncbi:hypothetical protein, conserved [Eimeria maxima]|uniref:Uncharacterized protein n=1 Tax=Eimeria maxima TaxID=5804 RepID=U6MBI6_EIMMA|nr:hypothetical protein, conserved [Eimeria maxima]CDJ59844.1 hypothetical protein, conserved [Eimeria maxima]